MKFVVELNQDEYIAARALVSRVKMHEATEQDFAEFCRDVLTNGHLMSDLSIPTSRLLVIAEVG